MEYRVIEFFDKAMEELAVFESAYDAVDYIVARAHQGEAKAFRMYVVDDEDTRIFGPTDLDQISRGASAA